MVRLFFFIILTGLYQNILHSQIYEWGKTFGDTGSDGALAVTEDNDGYLYTLSLLTEEPFLRNVFVEKLNTDGTIIWNRKFGNCEDEFSSFLARSILVDNENCVYIFGQFRDEIDFDPGLGVHSITSSGHIDCFLLKLDALGNFLFVKTFGGTNEEFAGQMAWDNSENIYLTGKFSGAVDFDPGIEEEVIIADDPFTGFILQLNMEGEFNWIKTYGGSGINIEKAIKIDVLGDIYIAGFFSDSVDFAPGLLTDYLVSEGGQDGYLQKLNSDGELVWAIQTGGVMHDRIYGIDTDESGIYLTGGFRDTVDFDPGDDEYLMTAYTEGFFLTDAFVQKLNKDGSLNWAITFGEISNDYGTDISTDQAGYLFVTGMSGFDVDFDPGAGVDIMGPRSNDTYILKLDTASNYQWARTGWTNGAGGSSLGVAVEIDSIGNVYLLGSYQVLVDLDPSDSVDMHDVPGEERHLFFEKLGDCGVTFLEIDSISNCDHYTWGINDEIYETDTVVYLNFPTLYGCDSIYQLVLDLNYSQSMVEEVEECFFFKWDEDGITYNNDTTVTYLYSDQNGCDSIILLDLNIILIHPTITLSGANLTANQDDATYQWLDCSDDMAIIPGATAQTYTALTNGTYAVVITIDGCQDTSACVTIYDLNLPNFPDNSIMIYPNPTNEFMNIDFSFDVVHGQVQLIDELGKVVFFGEINSNKNTLNISHLANGVYSAQIKIDNNSYYYKVIVTH